MTSLKSILHFHTKQTSYEFRKKNSLFVEYFCFFAKLTNFSLKCFFFLLLIFSAQQLINDNQCQYPLLGDILFL